MEKDCWGWQTPVAAFAADGPPGAGSTPIEEHCTAHQAIGATVRLPLGLASMRAAPAGVQALRWQPYTMVNIGCIAEQRSGLGKLHGSPARSYAREPVGSPRHAGCSTCAPCSLLLPNGADGPTGSPPTAAAATDVPCRRSLSQARRGALQPLQLDIALQRVIKGSRQGRMDDFEKAILFTFDQTGSVGPDIKAQSQVR